MEGLWAQHLLILLKQAPEDPGAPGAGCRLVRLIPLCDPWQATNNLFVFHFPYLRKERVIRKACLKIKLKCFGK